MKFPSMNFHRPEKWKWQIQWVTNFHYHPTTSLTTLLSNQTIQQPNSESYSTPRQKPVLGIHSILFSILVEKFKRTFILFWSGFEVTRLHYVPT
jgi:hypothetical protein